MLSNFGICIENAPLSEYFSEFIDGEYFFYKGFIQKTIFLHLPD